MGCLFGRGTRLGALARIHSGKVGFLTKGIEMSTWSQSIIALVLAVVGLSVVPGCPGLGMPNYNNNGNANNNGNGNGNSNSNDNDDNNNDNDDNSNDNDDDNTEFSLFTDPMGTFSTTHVRDVDGETIRFRVSNQSIVYQDGTEYQAGSWPVNGNFVGGNSFLIRFGTEEGERRAYFTETGPATICDFQVTPTTFSIFPTQVTVPQE